MKKLNTTIGIIAISMSLTGAAFAIPMGEIKINLDTSDFSFDDTSVDFEQTENGSGVINDATGDFVGSIGELVMFQDFNYASFPEEGIANLWAIIDDGISFSLIDLLYANYVSESGASFLTLYGSGWLHVDGEENVWASWTLSADEDDGVYNFSSGTNTAAIAIPDGGATHALLGLGIFSVVAISSRMKKAKKAAA